MTLLGRIFHTGCERETTVGRAALGLVAGAVTGAGLVAVAFTASMIIGGGGGGGSAMSMAFLALIFGFIIWLVGLVVLGAPGWWVLHRLGARCQQAAMIYGGGLAFLVGAFLTASSGGFSAPGLVGGIVLGIAGIAVGWVVAKVAYRPAPTAAPAVFE